MAGSEFERIERIATIFGEATPPDIGIGDDCALLHVAGALLATVDAAVEGVHFRREFLSLSDASSRAVVSAASDVAAMGGEVDGPGCGLLLAWALPQGFDDDDVDALARGARRAADQLNTRILGGNLTSAPTLSLTTTVLGRAGARVLTRGGARVGDAVAISGPIGAAALGLRALFAGRRDDRAFAPFIDRWRAPRARFDAAREIVCSARSAVDISDGLVQDAAHIARASGHAMVLHAELIPMIEGQQSCAAALGVDALMLALMGGEDYELIATGDPDAFGASWTIIGEVTTGEGVRVLKRGAAIDVSSRGWDHFARR